MERVVHFEIPADNPKRAVDFYRTVFGWQINDWGQDFPYFLCKTGEPSQMGIDGAIMGRDGTAKGVVNTIGVESIAESVELIKRSGGKQITDRSEIPNIGLFCYCEDTEGNLIGILEAYPRTQQ
jgi:uncharacterized protein